MSYRKVIIFSKIQSCHSIPGGVKKQYLDLVSHVRNAVERSRCCRANTCGTTTLFGPARGTGVTKRVISANFLGVIITKILNKQKGQKSPLRSPNTCTQLIKRDEIRMMARKSKVQRLEAHFCKVDVWSLKSAKRIVWSAKYPIFSFWKSLLSVSVTTSTICWCVWSMHHDLLAIMTCWQ